MSGGVIDEIKSKLDIVQVVSDYVQLKKAGSAWKACCPFHTEQSPSFMVNPDRQRFHCFGCSEDGDIFGFVEKMEGVDFNEAKKILARKAGVVLRAEDIALSNERELLVKINAWAAKFYHHVLLRSSLAENARAYVKKRGLKEETLEDFLIGYSPNSWDATAVFLRKKGFKETDAFRAGLLSKSDRGRGYFDRFRDRLMFPITDHSGNVIGFTARIVPDAAGNEPKDAAKYINTAQTPIYNKGSMLFGLDKAKRDIRKKGLAVIVEGNMDVIASHQAGVANVVASSGTAFTHEQLALLQRYAKKLVLSFDNDAAGENAARRSIDAAVAAGFAVRILRLPPGAGKDPDDCIRKDPAIWSRAVADAVPFMEWYIDLVKSRVDLKDPDAKTDAADSLLKEVAKLPDPVERAHWLKVLAEFFETQESLLLERVQVLRIGASGRPKGETAVPKPKVKARSRMSLASELIVGAVLAWPEFSETVFASLRTDRLDDASRPLYSAAAFLYNEHRKGGSKEPLARFPFDGPAHREIAELAAVAALHAEKEFGELTADQRREEVAKLIGELKHLHIARRQRELKDAMARAEKAGDQASIKELSRQINELIA